MRILQYLPLLLAAIASLTIIAWSNPTANHVGQHRRLLSHASQRNSFSPDSKLLPGRPLSPRANIALSLHDGWVFYCESFSMTIPIQQASSHLQQIYLSFHMFAQSQSSTFRPPTRHAVSLSLHGLDLRFEPDQTMKQKLAWPFIASFCRTMLDATQRGFVGKYQGFLLSAT